MTFINILIVAIWKSRQAFRAYGRVNMPLQAVKLPISHNNVVGENTELVVQNPSPTRLRLVGDELWTTPVRTPVSKMFRWRTYNSHNKKIIHFPLYIYNYNLTGTLWKVLLSLSHRYVSSSPGWGGGVLSPFDGGVWPEKKYRGVRELLFIPKKGVVREPQ